MVRFVTRNPGKLREARAIFAAQGLCLAAVRRSLPELQADRLATVVRAKLRGVADLSGTVLVEDSGLFIDSLGGLPGVYSAPLFRAWGLGPIVELLRHRPRAATFRAVVGIRWPDGSCRLVAGAVRGTIARNPRGRLGFGFDPIFCPGTGRTTFGQMPAETKSALSHRGVAMRRAARLIRARAPPDPLP